MHVHEINPKKTIGVVIVFVLILIVGFLTMKRPTIYYQQNMQQSLQMVKNNEGQFYPYQLTDVVNKKNKDVVLIDIRNKFEFGQGHIPGAYSIPAYDLADIQNINRMKEWKKNGTTVVLYGENQLQSNGPWMFFNQVGFANVKTLLGGYNYYKTHKNSLNKTVSDRSYIKGVPCCDYAKVAKSNVNSGVLENSSKKKPLIIRRKKKSTVASGGC